MIFTPSTPTPRNLIYTIVMDAPGSETYRFLGKMLVSSLLRTFFTGDILVFRNSPAPLFLVERKGLEEVYLETPDLFGQERADVAWCWKYMVADLIEQPEQYDKILFLDADCLALRNVDHLLSRDWDVRCQTERGRPMSGKTFHSFLNREEMVGAAGQEGFNSGTLAVRGSRFREVMEAWRAIDESPPVRELLCRDQASWNACVLRGSGQSTEPLEKSPFGGFLPPAYPWSLSPFPAGEIQFPGWLDPQFSNYRNAALTHNILPNSQQKIEFTFGLYMRTFFCDPSGLFLSILEM